MLDDSLARIAARLPGKSRSPMGLTPKSHSSARNTSTANAAAQNIAKPKRQSKRTVCFKSIMIPLFLTQIRTRDGLILDGVMIEPRKKSDAALVWIHGLTSSFYSSPTLIKELSDLCQKNGIGYFKFNTRGHDVVARGHDTHPLLGTVYEQFEDCVHDIRAIIRCARKRGYKKIILAGHSTGANKTLYYLYKTRDRNVKGIVLLGAANDISAEIKRVGEKIYEKELRLAQRLNRRDPSALFASHGYLFTARRALSLFTPGAPEDVFPYYDPKARWKELRSIRVPTAVIFGSKDACLNRPAPKIIDLFRANAPLAKSFSGVIIKNADHGFKGKEKELSREIIRWIKTLLR